MRYQGSKRSMIKDLKVLIENNLGKCKYYIEPFGGGMNSFAYISHPNKIALDINKHVIAMWKGIQNHTFTIPEKLSEAEYYDMKNDCLTNGGKYDSALLGYVGNACSNGCGWWNGYAHYDAFDYPDNSFIYCDPPYESTKGYNKNGFDNLAFWEWCRTMVKKGHKVMISEYNAPFDFVCVWQKTRKDGMGTVATGGTQKTKVEKVFIHRSQVKDFTF